MKKHIITTLLTLLYVGIAQAQTVKQVPQFENTNHPQIGYWFLTGESLENKRYLKELEGMMENSMLDFFFLDARHGARFQNTKVMHKVLKEIVEKAHEKGVKIGLRVRVLNEEEVPDEDKTVFLEEAETQLDGQGNGTLHFTTDYIRYPNGWEGVGGVTSKKVFQIYAFKKTGSGFYDPATLQAISSDNLTAIETENGLEVIVKGGTGLSGMQVYGMVTFHVNRVSNYSPRAVAKLQEFIAAYSDIPLDGIMLDEHSNERIVPPWNFTEDFHEFRARYYSPYLQKTLEKQVGASPEMIAFNMRYAPTGKPEVRIKAINHYMQEMRKGPLNIEHAMYAAGKKTFGEATFIGAHNTFHNDPISDEFWATGMNWWTIPREYGHSDIHVPIQDKLGIGLSYPAKAMYNMDFDPSIQKFQEKAFTDLRYGIRTHYHAFNDAHTGWGVTLEDPVAYAWLNPVEKAARLLNRFNPALPKIDVLVIFGMEGFANWYPNHADRGDYDINDAMRVREKSQMILEAGYTTAVVSSDLIHNGTLKINGDGQAEIHGQVFESIVYINPQYAKQSVLEFLENYVNNGGRLMLEGKVTHDFDGNDLSDWFDDFEDKVTVPHFSVEQLISINASKNEIENGVRNRDGSMVFTDLTAFRNGEETTFRGSTIRKDGKDWYEVTCKGFAALEVTKAHGVEKLAAFGFRELRKNGQVIFSINENADVYLEKTESGYLIEIADPRGRNKVLVNQL